MVVVVVVVWVFCAGCSGVVVVWGRVHKGAGRRAGAFFVAVCDGGAWERANTQERRKTGITRMKEERRMNII